MMAPAAEPQPVPSEALAIGQAYAAEIAAARLSMTGNLPRRRESRRDITQYASSWREKMKLSAPKQISWLVALILGVLGLIGALFTVPFLTNFAFWFVFVGLVLMLAATYFEGL